MFGIPIETVKRNTNVYCVCQVFVDVTPATEKHTILLVESCKWTTKPDRVDKEMQLTVYVGLVYRNL